jgi:hypothetical protein
MDNPSIPAKAMQALLEDASARDRATARRLQLFKLLWAERFLTRAQLFVRLEGILGRRCFGVLAWEDTFYRDMRVVKQAFKHAGIALKFSRSKKCPGYYLEGQPRLLPDLAQALAGSLREVDEAQIAIFRRLTPAERYRQGCSVSETARRAVIYRTQKRQPELSHREASRLVSRQRERTP